MAKAAARAAPRITRKQYKDAYRVYFHYASALRDMLEDRYEHLSFCVDPIIALNVAIATYDDIDRYKSYHLRNDGDSRSDVVKRAAYFAKWTTKLRPIMLSRVDDTRPPRDPGLLVNEVLAIAYALELISSEIGRNIKLTTRAHTGLLYDLHYRDMSSDALLAYFQVVSDLARARKPNPMVEFSIA